MPDVNIKGFEELDRQLEKLSLVGQRAVLVKAVRAGAEPIRRQASDNAPKATGGLAGDIVTQLRTSENSIDQVVVRIGPTKKHFYGSFHDRGTKFLTATHWLMRAFEQQQGAATALIAETLKTEIAKALK